MKNMFFSVVLVCSPTLVAAQNTTCEIADEELKVICQFARDFCGSYLREGETMSFDINAEASAEIEGLLSRLADLSADGSVALERTQYENVLQEELAAEIQGSRDCRLILWQDLRQRVTSETSSGNTTHGEKSPIVQGENPVVIIN